MSELTLRHMLKAGVHFGHQTRYWSPSMAPYIFGDRNKIHIINLEKTLPMMKEAMNFLSTVVAQGGHVLMVGTKRQAGRIIREQAQRSGSPYVDYRWLGGMLTNFKTVKNSISKLKELERRIESGEVNLLTKKEALTIERERTKLDRTLSGIKDMRGLPEALFVIDVEAEYIAVKEANKLGIPVIAVVDTNCSVKGIDYVIPGNDDSARAIELYLTHVADTVLAARSRTKTIVAPAGDDEYIELDDEGNVIAQEEASSEKAKPKAKPAKAQEPVKAEQAASEPEAEAEAAPAGDDADKAVTKKKTTKKKVVRKKTVSSETDKSDS